MTHASRDTTTGLNFEKQIVIKNDSICLTKNNLYKYLEKNGIDWTTILSRKLLPDEAYYNPTTKEFSIYEKKYQQTEGSANEKPQTCGFKIWEYKSLVAQLAQKRQLILIFLALGSHRINIVICLIIFAMK